MWIFIIVYEYIVIENNMLSLCKRIPHQCKLLLVHLVFAVKLTLSNYKYEITQSINTENKLSN